VEKVRCVILNRNYPPLSGVTGHSAAELADFLISRNIEVHIVSVCGSYEGGGLDKEKVGRTHIISTLYSGRQKILRLFSNLIEGFLMIRKALSLDVKFAICMTDPPLLNLWAALFFKKNNISWVYWSMDLYPEAFYAAKLVSENNIIYRYIYTKIKQAPPKYLLALGNLQLEYIIKKYGWNVPGVVLPCGITSSYQAPPPIWSQASKNKLVLGYVGNLGEAHDANFVYEVIRQIDESKHIFVLSIYGTKAAWLFNLVKHHPGVIVINSIPQSELGYIDVHLVTLKPNWNHICVPSKAFSAVSKLSTILFCGDEFCDNWRMLEACAWRIDPSENLQEDIEKWFFMLTKASILLRKENAKGIIKNLQEIKIKAYEGIYNFLK